MAVRYSGPFTFQIQVTPDGRHNVRIYRGRRFLWSAIISPPNASRLPTDSRLAIKKAAEAAVSFAGEERREIDEEVEYVRGNSGKARIRVEPYRRIYRHGKPAADPASLKRIIGLAQKYRSQLILSTRQGAPYVSKELVSVLQDALLERYGEAFEHRISSAEAGPTRSVVLFDYQRAIHRAREGRDTLSGSADSLFHNVSPLIIQWSMGRPKGNPLGLKRGLIVYVGKTRFESDDYNAEYDPRADGHQALRDKKRPKREKR